MKRQRRGNKKLILGITGGFGSGKTTVARMFISPGVKIIDVDRIAHRIIKPKTSTYKKIAAVFGKGILRKNKAVNRCRLARAVFGNKGLLKKLNKIMHPRIIRVIKNEISSSPEKTVILDAPLLIEAGLSKMADKLIVVKITRHRQMRRLLKKTGLNRIDILKRIKTQYPLSYKVRLADFVIDNTGSIAQTKRQVGQIKKNLNLVSMRNLCRHG